MDVIAVGGSAILKRCVAPYRDNGIASITLITFNDKHIYWQFFTGLDCPQMQNVVLYATSSYLDILLTRISHCFHAKI